MKKLKSNTKLGRKTKLNKKLIKTIMDYILQGYTEESSASLAGLGLSTYYRYKANNKEFREGIEWAVVGNKDRCLSSILRQAFGEEELDKNGEPTGRWIREPNWRAAAWWLERRFPEEYGKKARKTTQPHPNRSPVIITNKLLP
jgi:hypothetical protein